MATTNVHKDTTFTPEELRVNEAGSRVGMSRRTSWEHGTKKEIKRPCRGEGEVADAGDRKIQWEKASSVPHPS